MSASAVMRAVVLGLEDAGRLFCEAAAKDVGTQLVAVGDPDRARAVEAAEAFGVEAYDDCRSAIVEQRPDILLLALPAFKRSEYLRLATELDLPVLMAPPPCATLEAAVDLLRAVESAKTPVSIARIWQSEPAYMRLANIDAFLGPLVTAHVNILCPTGDLNGWRGDSARAGGGVLLNDAYEAMDAIVGVMGMPEQIYAVCSYTNEPGQTRAYDTEDVATVMMRYSQERVASLNCRRLGERRYWRYRLHGVRATALMTPEEMTIGDDKGAVEVVGRVRSANPYSPALSVFVTSLAAGVSRLPSPLEEHLQTLAAIKTAYLSARTGQPESPGKFYKIETGRDVPE